MTNDADKEQPASKRMRTVSLAMMALLIGAIGTAWGYQALFSGMNGEEQRAVSALKKLAMVDVDYDDQGSVVELRASSHQMTDAAAEHLAMLHSLQRLNLNQSAVTDKSLEVIASLPKLKSLYLEQTTVTSAGVAKLAACTQLEELMLRDCPIDDQALETIGGLTNLTLLDLSHTKISDAGMRQLNTLSKLKTIYLQATAVTGSGFTFLTSSPNLELINLSYAKVDQETIAALRAFRALERLSLGSSSLNDDLVPELMETLVLYNSKLRGLSIPQVPLTDMSVEPLKRLAELSDLAVVDLRDTQISEAAYLELAKSTPEINYQVSYSLAD